MPVHNFSQGATAPESNRGGRVLYRFIMGVMIGVATITPGLSGGVIAAAAGMYEPLLYAISHIHKEFKRSVFYLVPIGIGAVAGVLLFSNVMSFFIKTVPATVVFIFLGIVVGSLPPLINVANRDGFKKHYLLVSVAAFALVLFFGGLLDDFFLQGGMGLDIPGTLASGTAIAIGTIVPGISPSFLLIQLGVYEKLLHALTHFNIRVLLLTGASFIIVALVLVWLADKFFRRFHGIAYYTVIGFLAASIVLVFPGFENGMGLALDTVLFLVSAILCYYAMRLRPHE